ncbi:hypothetical protein DIC82_17800 [Clostridium beijerinckii]|nr:hypothetical protein DIC82_17800 [Clostridium beijerinckii]
MTILEMLNNKYENNKLIVKSLEVIKDNFTNFVNDNYELTIDLDKELMIKIPSLEKKNEYVYNSIGEYEYTLVMCMRISEMNNAGAYEYILSKFLELYKDKLELFFKDVNTVDKLMEKIIKTKNYIDYITYVSMGLVIFGLVSLCIFTMMPQIIKNISIAGMILFAGMSLVGQLTKENQVKKVIDGYISVIKTEWYGKQLIKEYAFLCNYIG